VLDALNGSSSQAQRCPGGISPPLEGLAPAYGPPARVLSDRGRERVSAAAGGDPLLTWPAANRLSSVLDATLGGVDGSSAEKCSQCRFDSTRWKRSDAAALFEGTGWWWKHATKEFSSEELNRRPALAVWSVLEYGLHTALAAAAIRTEVEAILAQDGCTLDVEFDIGDATGDNWAVLDRWATLADLEREGAATAVTAGRPDGSWANVGWAGNVPLQAEAYLIHDAHDISHHMMDVSRALAALSRRPAAEGLLVQINASDGSLPKRPIPRAALTTDGVSGDRQRDPTRRGRPFQSVCLWSAEVIDQLAAAGHPIGPGCAGENLTLRGVNWGSLRPGSLIRLTEALVELSFPARPGHDHAPWFADRDFSRIAHEVNPQWAPWYGWVRQPGPIQAGERVVVQS
jgi:MOSC domain-containing protein YiiM